MTYSPNFRGASAKASSRQTQTGYQNGTVSTLTKGTPVTINGSSQMILVDVTSESSVDAIVGLTSVDTPSAANGTVVDCGRLENITTSFNVRDILYIDKSGALTNIQPTVGVNSFVHGDYVVLVGVVVENEFDNTKKDIKLMLSVVGQL